jgi:hypothetical protein
MAALLEILEPASIDARVAADRYLKRYPHGVAVARARRILSAAPVRADP